MMSTAAIISIFVVLLIGIAVLNMALNLTLRKTFLYLFASVGLILNIIAAVSLINLGLKTYVLTKADNYCFYENRSITDPARNEDLTQEEIEKQNEIAKQNCEDNRVASKQGQAANAIAMLIVGLPLYFYHWHVIRRDKEI